MRIEKTSLREEKKWYNDPIYDTIEYYDTRIAHSISDSSAF